MEGTQNLQRILFAQPHAIRLRTGEEGDRGCDVWIASLTQGT